MTANAKSIKPFREAGTMDGIRPGETLDDFERRVGDDAPELTAEEFKRARPISDFPELQRLIEQDGRRERPAPEQVDVSKPVSVRFDAKTMMIGLDDGRVLTVPISVYPDLLTASSEQREGFVLTPLSVQWPAFGEEARIADILRAQLKIAALERARGQRGPQKAPVKDRVGLRLDHDVVEHFRATGPGWQSRINDILVDHVKRNRT